MFTILVICEAVSELGAHISNFEVGVNVPTPTFPSLLIKNGVESGFVSSSTKNELPVPRLFICNLADGEDMPIHTSPVMLTLPVTPNDPVICADPVYGNGEIYPSR